jgi:hypothetical protein
MKACMRKLPSKSEISSEVVKSVGYECKLGSGNLESIDGLIRRRRFEAMLDEPGIAFLDVELIAVVANNNIGFIEQGVEIADEIPVVLYIFLEAFVIREGFGGDFLLALPFVGEGKDVPGFL